MKKAFIAFGMLLMTASIARADISHRLQTSVQLTVDSAASQATRVGSTYSVSGSNISLDTAGGLGSLTAGSGVGYSAADYSVTSAGNSFSFSEGFLEGDNTPTATSVTAGVTPTLPMLGNTTTTAGGVAGSLAGTISSGGIMTMTAGGAGTSATGQFVSEISIY